MVYIGREDDPAEDEEVEASKVLPIWDEELRLRIIKIEGQEIELGLEEIFAVQEDLETKLFYEASKGDAFGPLNSEERRDIIQGELTLKELIEHRAKLLSNGSSEEYKGKCFRKEYELKNPTEQQRRSLWWNRAYQEYLKYDPSPKCESQKKIFLSMKDMKVID